MTGALGRFEGRKETASARRGSREMFCPRGRRFRPPLRPRPGPFLTLHFCPCDSRAFVLYSEMEALAPASPQSSEAEVKVSAVRVLLGSECAAPRMFAWPRVRPPAASSHSSPPFPAPFPPHLPTPPSPPLSTGPRQEVGGRVPPGPHRPHRKGEGASRER
jgi:hypothetical protein